MIVELRIYKLKPGKREDFIKLFDAEATPAFEKVGIKITGAYRSLDDPDTFVWMRSFESVEKREELIELFYGSDYWLNDLKPRIAPLVEDASNKHILEPHI